MVGTGDTQCAGSRLERGTGGDDVVDEKDASGPSARAGDEHRPRQAFGPAPSGLGCTVDTVQEPSTRDTEPTGERTGHQLRLVEAAPGPPIGARRRPGDDVHADRPESLGEERGERPGDTSLVAVLEGGDRIATHPCIGDGGHHTARRR